MAVIIKNRQVANNTWQLLRAGAEQTLPAVPPTGDVIVSLAQWQAQKEALLARGGRLGVWLANTDDPANVAADLKHFEVVAVDFPHFTDGRGSSIARLLRERYGWQGELRAIGDVIRDVLFYLSRCGFDAFEPADGATPEAWTKAASRFRHVYQRAADDRQVAFEERGN